MPRQFEEMGFSFGIVAALARACAAMKGKGNRSVLAHQVSFLRL